MKEVIVLKPDSRQPEKRKRVAAYARVSDDSDPMIRSVEAQVSYYSRMIQRNPKWEYAGVFADRGISGTGTKHRDAFHELMVKCDKGEVDIILCKSISRFARNTVDLLSNIRHLKEIGVEVRFEREKISTFSKEGEFMLTILASFAQEESRSISENVKWGMRKQMQAGTAHYYKQRIVGYCYDEEQQKYVIVPEEAETVRYIFREYLHGVSLSKIARILTEKGVRKHSGGTFDTHSLADMIENPIYVGDLLHQKLYVESHLTHKPVTNHGELPQYLYKDCHEPIIDKETFEMAAEIHEKRRKMYLRHKFGYQYDAVNKRFVIVPKEAEAVKLIFKLYVERYNCSVIAKKLNELGYRSARGSDFNINILEHFVRDTFYDPNDQTNEPHDPILDSETYEKVEAERQRRKGLHWTQI